MRCEVAIGIVLVLMMTSTEVFSEEQKLVPFFKTAEQGRVVWRIIKFQNLIILGAKDISEEDQASVSKLDEAVNRAELLQQKNSLCDNGVIVYFKARAKNGHVLIAKNELVQIASQDAEFLLGNLKSPMEEESLRMAGMWIHDLKKQERYSELFHPNIIIPIRGNGSPIEFGEMEADISWVRDQSYAGSTPRQLVLPYQFKTLGLYDKAWRSFYEHINPYELIHIKNSTGAGEEVAVYWYQAADCAYRAGEKRLGWNLLMKAAVFGDENTFNQAKETAALWFDCEENDKELSPPEPFAIPWYHESKLSRYGMKELLDEIGPDFDPKSGVPYADLIESRTWHNPRLRDAMLRRTGAPGLTEKEIRRESWDFIIAPNWKARKSSNFCLKVIIEMFC